MKKIFLTLIGILCIFYINSQNITLHLTKTEEKGDKIIAFYTGMYRDSIVNYTFTYYITTPPDSILKLSEHYINQQPKRIR